MPIYCFSTNEGETVERFFRMGEAPQSIRLDSGQVATRDYRAERIGMPARKGWPIECFASGVHANQAGELREFFRRHGESIHVTSDGNPVYTSPAQRKRALKLRGMCDRSSFC
jgi:hypothetical protein